VLLVTCSEEVRRTVERLHERGPLRDAVEHREIMGLTVVSSLDEMLEFHKPCAFLLMGMAAYERQRNPFKDGTDYRERMLETFRRFHPSTVSVLITSRERSIKSIALVQWALQTKWVITTEEMSRADEWYALLRENRQAIVTYAIRDQFVNNVGKRVIPAREEVMQVLENAPRHTDVEGLVRTSPLGYTADHFTRVLRRQRQHPPKSLLIMFRTLWYLKLLKRGWRKKDIAEYMAHPDSNAQLRTINRTLDVDASVLDSVPYEAAAGWIAERVTEGSTTLFSVPAKQLLRPMFDQYAKPL
jgi:hypothetical protein